MLNCTGVHTEIVHLERTARMSAHCCVRWFLVSRIKQAGGTFVLELSVRNSCYHHILITLQSRHTLTMVSHFCHSKDEISASQV